MGTAYLHEDCEGSIGKKALIFLDMYHIHTLWNQLPKLQPIKFNNNVEFNQGSVIPSSLAVQEAKGCTRDLRDCPRKNGRGV